MYHCEDVFEKLVTVDVLLPYDIPIGFLCLTQSISFLFFMHETVFKSKLYEQADPRDTNTYLPEVSYENLPDACSPCICCHFMKCRYQMLTEDIDFVCNWM